MQTQTVSNPNMKAFGFLQHTQSSGMRNNILKLERDFLNDTTDDAEKLVKNIPNVVPEGHYLASKEGHVTVIRQISHKKLKKNPTKKQTTKENSPQPMQEIHLLRQKSEDKTIRNTPEPMPKTKKKSKSSLEIESNSENRDNEQKTDPTPKRPTIEGEEKAQEHKSMNNSKSQ